MWNGVEALGGRGRGMPLRTARPDSLGESLLSTIESAYSTFSSTPTDYEVPYYDDYDYSHLNFSLEVFVFGAAYGSRPHQIQVSQGTLQTES